MGVQIGKMSARNYPEHFCMTLSIKISDMSIVEGYDVCAVEVHDR